MSRAREILDFWFGKSDEPGYGKPRKIWFSKEAEFDEEIRAWFFCDYQQAAAGYLDNWIELPQNCLALILLLDQFPRNIFRGTPDAFATDWQALSAAQQAIAKGYDRQFLPVQRWFFYLPFEHSENLKHQHTAVELFLQLANDEDNSTAVNSAIHHRQIIERFGRFPHRNEILGRLSTPEEKEFLKNPGSSF
ncbi:MAG: DUF924 family protein [Calothrix sp. MO_167.B42]|nr:DUF924 family protein [Calothrix sp. MO_167.B42]